MKLLVRNLARTTTEPEIQKLFSRFGAITECTLVLDKVTGDSKGFAFVEMPNETEGSAALTKLHMSTVAGSKIRVKLADA